LCFLAANAEQGWFKNLKAHLDDLGLDRVCAWDHPAGSERGRNWAGRGEMVVSVPRAKAIGADVMRVIVGSPLFRYELHGPQIKALVRISEKGINVVEDAGSKVALENHIGILGDEIFHSRQGRFAQPMTQHRYR
jgi:hypothetical protein